EHGRTRDQNVRAGAHDLGGVLRRHAAIDFDIDRAGTDECSHIAELVDRCRNESLSPKPRIDRHNENEIDQVYNVFNARYRCRGVHGNARLLTKRADRLQRAVYVRPGFDVHRYDVGARLCKAFEIWIAWRDHQMDVERLSRKWTDCLNDSWSD